jgi:nucleotide-binding universal stress UspA family protein
MFKTILNGNDGSDYAFKALSYAIDVARQNGSDLHMVCVEEIDYAPEFIEEIREQTGTASRRFQTVIQRANTTAAERDLKIMTHVLAGRPVRDIVQLAGEIGAELLVVGATGHSALYERLIGGRADRILQLAPAQYWSSNRPHSLIDHLL